MLSINSQIIEIWNSLCILCQNSFHRNFGEIPCLGLLTFGQNYGRIPRNKEFRAPEFRRNYTEFSDKLRRNSGGKNSDGIPCWTPYLHPHLIRFTSLADPHKPYTLLILSKFLLTGQVSTEFKAIMSFITEPFVIKFKLTVCFTCMYIYFHFYFS